MKKVELVSKEVKFESRQIRTEWTREMMFDISYFKDWEEEMERILLREMVVLKRKQKLLKILSK
jgi:activator of HSP90 ATPase